MFEKEAEEFERRKHYRYEDNDYCGDIADGIIQAYQQGAEFGYNKCNEQLTKAKEIIKDYLTIAKGAHTAVCGVSEENRTINVLKLNEEAEQLLRSKL